MNKKFISVQGILEGLQKENPNKPIELYVPLSRKEIIKLNNRKMYELRLRTLSETLHRVRNELVEAIDQYRNLYHHTEYFEKEYCYQFNFKDWNTLKKVNGRLTRYYNDIFMIHQNIERELFNIEVEKLRKGEKNENNHNLN